MRGIQWEKRSAAVVVSSAQFKATHSAKSAHAWRYLGGVIQRAPTVKLGGITDKQSYTDPKDPGQPRRKQERNFFITINTNKAPFSPEAKTAGVQHLKAALEHQSKDFVLAACLKFGPVDEHYSKDKYAAVITNGDWKSAIETGEIQSRLHAHVWLTITHYSQIQLNSHQIARQVKRVYNEKPGPFPESMNNTKPEEMKIGRQPYVHKKLLPQGDWANVMRNYVTKNFASASCYAEVH